MATRFPYGRDRYQYIDGVRHKTASGVSLQPFRHETAELFAQRVDHIARESTKLPDVRSVEVDEIYNQDVLVQCIVLMHHDPIPAPLESSAIGGRISPRGRRGGKKAA